MNKRIIVQCLAILVIATSIVVMIGWIFDVAVLKSILPIWVTMKFITALCFFFSGMILLSFSFKEKGETSEFFILIFSFTLLLLMVTFLISLFSGVSTGIESLFVKEAPGAVRTVVPGVPAVPTIICFILIGACGMFFIYNSELKKVLFSLGLIIGLIGLVAVFGYIFNVPLMYYSFEGFTSMAFHTALLFIFLGGGIVLNSIRKDETKN